MDRRGFVAACSFELRQIAISMAIGCIASILYAIGRPNTGMLTYAIAGAFVGFCIYALISVLGLLFNPFIRMLPPPSRIFAEVVKYAVGGAGGWFLGVTLVPMLFGDRPSIPTIAGPVRTFMLVTAGLAVAVGLLWRAFEMMEQRLRERDWAERELEIARSIQTRLLPPAEVAGDGFAISARNLPAHYVAGDFYDIVRLDDGSVMVVLADVAGKGIGAGLIMSSVKAVLPFLAQNGVASTMKALNAKLSSELGRREFVAVVCARYQPESGMVEIANGGCPDPYLVTRNGVEALSCSGIRLPLGVNRQTEYSVTRRRIEPGERLVFVSDGIPEAPMNDGQPLGYETLQQIIAGMSRGNDRSGPWLDRLLQEVRARVGATLSDDWTALLLECGGAAAALRVR